MTRTWDDFAQGRLSGMSFQKGRGSRGKDKMRGSFDSARCAPLRMTAFFCCWADDEDNCKKQIPFGDDSREAKARADARAVLRLRRWMATKNKQQIPPLRCGMTNKRTSKKQRHPILSDEGAQFRFRPFAMRLPSRSPPLCDAAAKNGVRSCFCYFRVVGVEGP